MDPDLATDQLITLAYLLHDMTAQDNPRQATIDLLSDLRELSDGLLEWLGKGGYLPHPLPKPDGHSGYANRETWNLAMWLTNDERLYFAARAVLAAAKLVNEEPAEHLRAWVADELWDDAMKTENGRLLFRSVGSLWRVDWNEVAEAVDD